MRSKIAILLAGALAGSLACGDFNIPNTDAPSIDALQANPTPSVVEAAAQGLFAGFRAATTANLSIFAHYGREGYYVDVAQTSLVAFDVPLTPNDGAGWANTYQYVRLCNAIYNALGLVGAGLTNQQQEGIRGFTKTAEAYFLHGQIRAQDSIGISTDTNHPLTDPLPPVLTKAQSFAFILQRLDDAYTSLGNAGNSFPFQITPGFTPFTTPTAFQKFNRALKARVLIEMANGANPADPGNPTAYANALAAVNASFIDTTQAMSLGAYNNYGTGSGDLTNPFFDPNGVSYVADTLLPLQAQLQPGGAVDQRVTNKMVKMAQYRTHTRVTSNYRWIVYSSNTASIPVIKNEELILIRAEAEYNLGQTANALADINVVRAKSGLLAPLAGFADQNAFNNELLYNRKYSLLFEFGHRWIDLRRFGRLQSDLIGPRGPGDLIFFRVPLPRPECDARGNTPAPACSQTPQIATTS